MSSAVEKSTSAASSSPPRPLVGVGVYVVDTVHHPGCVLIGERLNSHGSATFALPGGHLEYAEEWSECAAREVKEETNLDVTTSELMSTSNQIYPDLKKHYVTLILRAEVKSDSAELKLMEPDKCKEWIWMDWQELKRKGKSGEMKLFGSLMSLVNEGRY